MLEKTLYEDTLPGGTHWSFVANPGMVMQLEDIEGGGNVGMLLYNPSNPLERLNLPDTLKCQHTFRLTKGHCLYSDMGRIFCSVVDDEVGWHDAVGGTCNAELVNKKWGELTYQEARNEFYRNGRDCFLIELGKYGLGRRDFAANVNWFSRVDVDANGNTSLDIDNSTAGKRVAIRFEIPTLVVMHTCPHPLMQSETYPRRAIGYRFGLAAQEPSLKLQIERDENRRGLQNNNLFLLGQ